MATGILPQEHAAPASRRMMAALMKTKPGLGNVELSWTPEPVCTPGKVKIDVRFTGICGTDIHVYHDRFPNFPPVILGHEFSGIVVETGEDVEGVEAGDRVTVLGSSAVVCGRCEYCQQGLYMFCQIRRGMGHGVNGSLTRYVVVRPDQVYKLPESVSLEEGAVTEPFASAVQAMEEMTSFDAGDVVLLSGPGSIGLLCLMLLARKCRVIVAGRNQDSRRLEVARNIGADATVDIDRDDLQSVIRKETEGRGVDVAVEAAGAAESIVNCLQAVKKTGKYLQLGIVGEDVRIPFDQILYKQLRVYGSVGHSLKTWRRVMKILAQRKVDLRPVITHILPLSKWREAFDLVESKQGIKVLLYYDQDGL